MDGFFFLSFVLWLSVLTSVYLLCVRRRGKLTEREAQQRRLEKLESWRIQARLTET